MGKMGVIIKNYSDDNPWWKCYQNENIGQVFNEEDIHFKNIERLYKVKQNYDKVFNALKFMKSGSLHNYNCVYEYIDENIVNFKNRLFEKIEDLKENVLQVEVYEMVNRIVKLIKDSK